MSRYRGPKLKITRRLGPLPGLTMKKSRKLNRPGKDGNSPDNNKKPTEYGIRLEEKQKLQPPLPYPGLRLRFLTPAAAAPR